MEILNIYVATRYEQQITSKKIASFFQVDTIIYSYITYYYLDMERL